jgi:hypothetical protein
VLRGEFSRSGEREADEVVCGNSEPLAQLGFT